MTEQILAHSPDATNVSVAVFIAVLALVAMACAIVGLVRRSKMLALCSGICLVLVAVNAPSLRARPATRTAANPLVCKPRVSTPRAEMPYALNVGTPAHLVLKGAASSQPLSSKSFCWSELLRGNSSSYAVHTLSPAPLEDVSSLFRGRTSRIRLNNRVVTLSSSVDPPVALTAMWIESRTLVIAESTGIPPNEFNDLLTRTAISGGDGDTIQLPSMNGYSVVAAGPSTTRFQHAGVAETVVQYAASSGLVRANLRTQTGVPDAGRYVLEMPGERVKIGNADGVVSAVPGGQHDEVSLWWTPSPGVVVELATRGLGRASTLSLSLRAAARSPAELPVISHDHS